jgi:hypothetical protein
MPLAILVLALAAQDPAPAAEHRFDLRALELLARASREDFDPRRPLEAPSIKELEFDSGRFDLTLDDDSSQFEGDGDASDRSRSEDLWREIVPAVAAHFLGEPLESRLEGCELVVVGDDRARAAARLGLALVERWMGRAWSLELIELPGAALDDVERAVLGPSEVDALLAAHPPVRRVQRRATTRRAARFEFDRLSPLVYLYDVEISDGGRGLTDPQVYVVRWGTDALAWVVPHLDGRAIVSCMWRSGEPLAEPRLSYVYGAGHRPIELAQGSGSRRIGSALLVDGGAFLLADGADQSLERGLAHGPLLVRLRALQDDHAGEEQAAFLGLGALQRVRPRTPRPHLAGPQSSDVQDRSADAPRGRPWPAFDEASDASNTVDLSDVLDEVRQAWEDAGMDATIVRLGTEALAVGPPEALALARAHLEARAEPHARTYTVELREGRVAPELADGLVTGRPIESSHPILHALAGRKLGAFAAGDALELTACHSWMYLKDLQPLEATGVELGWPIIGVVDSGTVLAARALPREDGSPLLGLQFQKQEVTPPPFPIAEAVSLRSATPDGTQTIVCELERPVCTASEHVGTWPASPGIWTVLAIEGTPNPPDDTAPGPGPRPAMRVVIGRLEDSRTQR